MNAAEIATKLGAAKKTSNGGWQCECPAHEDGKASLSLKDSKGGKFLWYCHAGCTQDAVADALKGLGLFPERAGSEGREQGQGQDHRHLQLRRRRQHHRSAGRTLRAEGL